MDNVQSLKIGFMSANPVWGGGCTLFKNLLNEKNNRPEMARFLIKVGLYQNNYATDV
jgi:hypothetical protein